MVLAIMPSSSQARSLVFSSQVPTQEVSQLRKDLSTTINLPSDANTLKVMNIGSLTDGALKQWLSDRVGYIIGEDEDINHNLVQLQQAFSYPNNILPTIERPTRSPRTRPDPGGGGGGSEPKPTMVMANVGVSFYYLGKTKQVLAGYRLSANQTDQVIPMTSPRVGIIQVGEGLFGMVPYEANPNSMVNTWFRLSTLFHEAHHSDGNGKSLGFLHATCPQSQGPYAGYAACDSAINGAYGVEAYLLNQVRKACMANNSCNAGEAEMLGRMIADSLSRLIGKSFLDPRPEGTVTGVSSGT